MGCGISPQDKTRNKTQLIDFIGTSGLDSKSQANSLSAKRAKSAPCGYTSKHTPNRRGTEVLARIAEFLGVALDADRGNGDYQVRPRNHYAMVILHLLTVSAPC